MMNQAFKYDQHNPHTHNPQLFFLFRQLNEETSKNLEENGTTKVKRAKMS
jgi:hypothetical protein